MKNDVPTAKIELSRSSLACFTCGLLGLLPAVGLPFAIVALVISARVRAGQRRFWNPAQAYWRAGVFCAVCGTAFWAFVLFAVIAFAVNNPDFR